MNPTKLSLAHGTAPPQTGSSGVRWPITSRCRSWTPAGSRMPLWSSHSPPPWLTSSSPTSRAEPSPVCTQGPLRYLQTPDHVPCTRVFGCARNTIHVTYDRCLAFGRPPLAITHRSSAHRQPADCPRRTARCRSYSRSTSAHRSPYQPPGQGLCITNSSSSNSTNSSSRRQVRKTYIQPGSMHDHHRHVVIAIPDS